MDKLLKVLLLLVSFAGLTPVVQAQDDACVSARFVLLVSPYIGRIDVMNDVAIRYEAEGQWTAARTRWLNVDEIVEISAVSLGEGITGALVRTKRVDQENQITGAVGADGAAGALSVGTGYMTFYYLNGMTVENVLYRAYCHWQPAPEPEPQSRLSPEAQDRAEARRFQVLQALDELTLGALL